MRLQFDAPFWRDARHYQIAALSTLVVFNLRLDRFRRATAQQRARVRRRTASRRSSARASSGVPLDLRSPLITGLSLSLLLRADEPWIHARAGVIAIGSKFLLRLDGKHIWNPAGFAIVVLLFATPQPCLDFARQLGLDGLVRGAARLLRDPGARRRAPRRHRGLLLRHARGAAARARALARRSAGNPAASVAERLAADLHVLHDLRSAHLAGLAARTLHLRGIGRRDWRTTWRSSCRCVRRSTSR